MRGAIRPHKRYVRRMANAANERARIEALIAATESRVRAAFLEFMRNVQNPVVLQHVANLLQAGRLDDAISVVDTYIIRLAANIGQLLPELAASETDQLAPILKPYAPLVAFSFEPGNEAAALLNRQNNYRLVRQLSQQQRRAIRSAVSRALAQGASMPQAARAFRDALGLTDFQEAAVANYRRLLQEGSGQALDRALRDRRYDRSVARAIRTGEPLTADHIESMVSRYRARYLAYRADNIARTEGLAAVSQARQLAMEQMLPQANLPPNAARRQWNNAGDERVRDTHDAMQGQEVGMDEPFTSPSGAKIRYPSDPEAEAKERIGCRCWVAYVIAQQFALAEAA